MIIFDLDGTLADCEHRRHFVERNHPINENRRLSEISLEATDHPDPNQYFWKPDWKSFYDACDKDTPIKPVCSLLFSKCYVWEIQIWSGRCESVREKTERWLIDNVFLGNDFAFQSQIKLKMRPIGDCTPDDELKEMWLHDFMVLEGNSVDFVFDDRPKVVRMWRRHGIFVFDCNQTGKEF